MVLEDQLYTLNHGLRRVLQAWRQLPGDAPLPRRPVRRVAGVEQRLGLAGVRQLVRDYQDGMSIKEVALRHKVAKESVLRLLRLHGVATRPSGINYCWYDLANPPRKRSRLRR